MTEGFARHVIDQIDDAVLQPASVEAIQNMHHQRTLGHGVYMATDCRIPASAALASTSRLPGESLTTHGEWRAAENACCSDLAIVDISCCKSGPASASS